MGLREDSTVTVTAPQDGVYSFLARMAGGRSIWKVGYLADLMLYHVVSVTIRFVRMFSLLHLCFTEVHMLMMCLAPSHYETNVVLQTLFFMRGSYCCQCRSHAGMSRRLLLSGVKGNASTDSYATATVTVDTTPPTLRVISAPGDLQTNPIVTIKYQSDPPGDAAVFYCRWVAGSSI